MTARHGFLFRQSTNRYCLLFRAGKSDVSVVHKAQHNLEALSTDKPGLESTIERNNSFDAEWGKTTEARNRLKMLQVAADAGKQG